MIEKWKTILNKKLKVSAHFMDLLKTFETLDHSLLLAKLRTYGSDTNSLSFIQSYLKNRIQRCKIEDDFSNWREITAGVPRSSILGPLLFNIFIDGFLLFVESSNVCNYADDNTVFAFGKTFDEVTTYHQGNYNLLVLNSDKCHFMIFGTPNTLPNFKCKNITIKSSASENRLGVIIDNKLDFTKDLNTVCKEPNLMLHALNTISRFFSPEQHVLIINAYVKSLFNYCLLV